MTELNQISSNINLFPYKTEMASTQAVRAHNLSSTLNLIRDRGSITRAEIIQLTKLSAPTISSLVNILIDSGFVREGGIGLSSGGRKPVVLEFNYDVRKILGIDMGSTHITIAMNLKDKSPNGSHIIWMYLPGRKMY